MKKRTRKKGNGRRPSVSAEDFVKAWAKGGTIQDVADRTGMTVLGASGRAIRFRAAGVKLPALERRSSRRIDPDALNAILRG